ncbi:MAG: DNA-binding protein [Erysipelotrichaceae bacterium]|nr:DNA-binding protein [Erysipelotrichaceae bacterium]MBQ1534676.1 DNA-binding protein [Erysipelotrichaceae bacterium]MBQ6126598.1 DNA-binding protein [Erysipelotrichaceae bacterium]
MQRNRELECLMLDYYGDLLTRHQRDILDEYFNEDLSMNEIAENYKVSKSAIQDLIKRSLNQLYDYEKNLKMIEKDHKLNDIMNEMMKEDNDLLNEYARKIEKTIR